MPAPQEGETPALQNTLLTSGISSTSGVCAGNGSAARTLPPPARGELDGWLRDADGALALVLLLDQIPRNIFRSSAHAFATDPLARLHAGAAIAAGFDAQVDPALRLFFYLPFEHSETLDDQDRSIALFKSLGPGAYLDYAIIHRDVIARFGRFPHRNRALGRASTPDEQAWLNAGGGF